jgi:glycosyltransferase involved in cell wall biosynthesis
MNHISRDRSGAGHRVAVVAWTRVAGRPNEIAEALGGHAYVITFAWPRWTAPLRYVLASALTAAYLWRRRPHTVVVVNPPIFAPLLVAFYCSRTRSNFLLDSHPGAFGLRQRVWRFTAPLHRWLSRRAAATLVTTESLASAVRAWGGTPLILHDGPPKWSVAPPTPTGSRPRILTIAVFADDEPIAAVLDAAANTAADWYITGDTSRAPKRLVASAPDNVRFTGWLQGNEYREELEKADVIVCLTTDDQSVLRGAYEAVYAGRVLVLSDTAELRALFQDAVLTSDKPADIARAVAQAIHQHAALRQRAPHAREHQLVRWASQLEAVQRTVMPPADLSPTHIRDI